MAVSTTQRLLNDATSAGRGLGAFNVITLEHAEAVVGTAERLDAPVVLQISQNAVMFHERRVQPLLAACTAVASAATVPVSLHLDHIEDESLLRDIEGTAVSSVMFDASRLEYADNLHATRSVASWAHERHLHLEAELGVVGGKDGAHAPGVRTDPKEAADFVAATGVDSLAVAVGSSHAMNTRSAALDHALIARIKSAVPVPLVLHGSSGVNDHGLRRAVLAGMVKINVGTGLNLAYTQAVRRRLEDETLVDPRKYLRDARDAMSVVVEQYLRALNGARAVDFGD